MMSKNRNPVWLVGATLLAAAAAGCPGPGDASRGPSAANPAATQPATAATDGRVENREKGFSIVPPEGYVSTPSRQHFMMFLGPGENRFTTNFSVTACTDTEDTPIEQAGAKAKSVLSMFLRDYVMMEDGVTMLDGRRCYWASGTFTWEGRVVRNLQYFIRGGNGRLFVVTFATLLETFDKHRPVFERTAQTARVN